MKKIIFITLLFCGLALSAQSQSLTYSKVILLTALDTVPQGKVWKVTSYLPDNVWVTLSYPSSYGELNVLINGADAKISHYSHSGSGGGGSLNETVPFPIWLPAGTTLEPSTNCGSLSIIEFTETNE
tara:strand:+ start:58 stop:438 length:381 start_codon:yes stop_codon:yes gene_type:complete